MSSVLRRSDTEQKISDERFGGHCRCKSMKSSGKPFCRGCFYSLPANLRGKLATREIGDGYEEAYEEALTVLRARGSIK